MKLLDKVRELESKGGSGRVVEGLISYISEQTAGQLIKTTIPPDIMDLERLYYLLTTWHCPIRTVLEFGSGWSTLVILAALESQGSCTLHTVEAESPWMDNTGRMLEPLPLADATHIWHRCGVFATKYAGEVCHLYGRLPNTVPDFIYLDGPDPQSVQGSVRGLSWGSCHRRPPVAADPLLYESTMLPGSRILVDGRTTNARFLRRNLKRDWRMDWYREDDVTLFTLDEERLSY